jgi:hypothetical protein
MGFAGEELERFSLNYLDDIATFQAEADGSLPEGYGRDPNLITPVRPWPLTLNTEQRTLLEVLSDITIPGPTLACNPSKLKIADFFDEWLSAPYPKQREDNVVILNGLIMLNAEAIQKHGKAFLALTSDTRLTFVDEMSRLTSPNNAFFRRFRYLAVGGYFTTDLGMRILGYRGNFPLVAFPSISGSALKTINDQLAILGLEDWT